MDGGLTSPQGARRLAASDYGMPYRPEYDPCRNREDYYREQAMPGPLEIVGLNRKQRDRQVTAEARVTEK